MPRARGERRQEILQTLASELERNPGARITTARLAQSLEVSEAALYRHFPSKARMYEGLIEFAEESVFSLLATISRDERDFVRCCERSGAVMLTFASRNPGIARVLMGDALVGEHERLRARVNQYFDRCETQFRQILNQYELNPGRRLRLPASVGANLMMAYIEGRIAQFLRSQFRTLPDADWARAWPALASAIFGAESLGTS
ncbi:MAG: TetR/AcrR family transcriptional regulator [Gammaproteobacteria bacterium]|jgi:TetR/AcrR family transcriptional regulator